MIFRFKSGFFRLFFILILILAFSNVDAAKLYFNDIYKATGSSYVKEDNSLIDILSISGSGFKFTSANESDVSFSGNNVAGILSYVNSSNQKIQIYGIISRQDKGAGNVTKSVNFIPTNSTYTTETGEGALPAQSVQCLDHAWLPQLSRT